MEETCQKREKSLSSLTLEEQNVLWEEAKRMESEKETEQEL
jgi:uncharacterized protein YabN with tetrapyrrole methylase and pyrophosphatase domain